MVDLAEFLISCGARIHGAGTRTLVITGVRKLHSTDFTIIPDRIEAGTFLIAAAITRSAISMSPVVPHHLTAVIDKLQRMGCKIRQTSFDSLAVRCSFLDVAFFHWFSETASYTSLPPFWCVADIICKEHGRL